MSTFTDAEIAYLASQPLGRLATVGAETRARLGAPFEFDEAYIRIHPRRILAWGIDTGSYDLAARDVEPAAAGEGETHRRPELHRNGPHHGVDATTVQVAKVSR
jgi:hypothetical protein